MSINKWDYVIYECCASINGPLAASVGKYQQTGLFSERNYPRCTCPAYKFAKRTINFGGMMVPPECKHILQAQKEACGWHEAYSDESQEKEGICPRCGGVTVSVRWAV